MTAPQPLGYSYVRFSDPAQAAGDSLRRQTDGSAEAFCERHGLTLDTTISLRDLGVSAFRGRHRDDKHDLGKFLELARRGRIPAGSYFIIENLDRLSREDERTALRLWMDILDLKINIVQLCPETVFKHEKSDMFDIMRAIMELSRAHGESAIKSERVGEAWNQRRKVARDGGILTRKLPHWVKEEGGKLVLIPERAEAVRRIFDLSGAGFGLNRILKKLNEESIPAFGTSGVWNMNYIDLILKDRRAVGELQLRRGKDADGEPIIGYFPRVVSDEVWHRARAGIIRRDRGRGRPMKDVNIFSGLMRAAGTGETYVVGLASGGPGCKSYRVIRSTAYRKGTGSARTFSLAMFEAGILSFLDEINPREVLGQEDGNAGEALDLSARLTVVAESIRAIEADMEANGESPTLFKRLRQKEDEQRAIIARQNELAREAALPAAEAWGELRPLLAALKNAPDREDARLRLRASIQRVVSVMTVLVVGRGRMRLCAVQMRFTGAESVRNYLVAHQTAQRAGTTVRPAKCWFGSLPHADEIDLRKAEDANAYADVLTALDLPALVSTLTALTT